MSLYLYKDNATELYVFKYKGFVFNPKPGSMMLIERESDGFVNLQAVYDNKAFRQNTNGHILNDFVDPQLILDGTGTAYGAAASAILSALSDFFVDAPASTGATDLLGGIAHNAAAPTPGVSGKYYFTSAGVVSWITGTPTVVVGDEVIVIYNDPNYTYTHLPVGTQLDLKFDKANLESARSQSATKVPTSKLLDDQLTLVSQKTIDERLNVFENILYPLSITGYVRANGSFNTDAAARRTDYIYINDSMTIDVNLFITAAGCALSFFDENKVFIDSLKIIGTGANRRITMTAPTAARYCIASQYSTSSNSLKLYKPENLESDVLLIKADVDSIKPILLSVPIIAIGQDILDKSSLVSNSYIYTSGGINNLGGESYKRTPSIKIEFITQIRYIGQLDTTYACIAFYNSPTISNATLVQLIDTRTLTAEQRKDITLDVPSGATHFAASFVGTDTTNFHLWITGVSAIEKNINEMAALLSQTNQTEVEYETSKDLSKLFTSFFALGDSLTQGVYYNQNARGTYPWYISKFTGWSAINGGVWGATPTTWWNNEFSKYNFADYEVLFMYLGTNDTLTDTIVADTTITEGQTYLDYANTQTGNYCKIIEGIKAQNPEIIICLISRKTVEATDKWGVVVKIANKYSLPVLNINDSSIIDLNDSSFHYPDIPDLTHFNATGRYYMAKILLGQFTKYVKANIDDFKYYNDEQL